MFETSQQEANSGSGKIIGGVVAVVVVALVVYYFVFLRGEPVANGTRRDSGQRFKPGRRHFLPGAGLGPSVDSL